MFNDIYTQLIGDYAYSDFKSFNQISYNCIKYMMDNNDLIWKLLKYKTPDAWNMGNLTQEEKASLIYAGQQDSSEFNVFMDGKQPDVLVDETTLVRIMPHYATGLNRTISILHVSMEVFSHYKINHLSNYTTRIDSIAGELLALFNGANIGTLGLLGIDKMMDQSLRLFQAGQIPFGGKQLIFGTYTA